MRFHLHPDGVLRLQQWNDIPWLIHGFTTRVAGDFASTRLGSAPHPWDSEGVNLVAVSQVHSDGLVVIKDRLPSEGRSPLPVADGLLTQQTGRLLSVRTADCLPLLFVDRRSRTVAAVHAGWRGTARQIALRAVEALRKEYGSRSLDLEVAIGPGIGPDRYEVGRDVADQFDRSFVVEADRPRLDLTAVNRQQLLDAGVPAQQIWDSGMCTASMTELFYSYRREGEKAGRMLAAVGIRPEPPVSENSAK